MDKYMNKSYRRIDGNTISVECMGCESGHTVPITAEEEKRWLDGELLQRVIPAATPDERELLISGLCGQCFDATFGDED